MMVLLNMVSGQPWNGLPKRDFGHYFCFSGSNWRWGTEVSGTSNGATIYHPSRPWRPPKLQPRYSRCM